ncbi:MAG: VOC family protein, partial [Acidimicrobiia bacterium]|nr:VOC family protein [Acidimicrobiia bacterium]
SRDPRMPGIIFEQVTDPKSATKNRVHLDLASVDRADQRNTVEALMEMGATPAAVGQTDQPWVVLADPEGNEFCVLEPRPRYENGATLASIVLNAVDPQSLAEFWVEATGWSVRDQAEDWVSLSAPDGQPPDLDLVRVPEAKQVKNRVHLDVETIAGGDRDLEVARLVALGATPADVGQAADASWVVLADPEGNEFCVLKAPQ